MILLWCVDLEHTILRLPIIDLDPQPSINISPIANHNSIPLPRRSARTNHPPIWMLDYVGSVSTHIIFIPTMSLRCQSPIYMLIHLEMLIG